MAHVSQLSPPTFSLQRHRPDETSQVVSLDPCGLHVHPKIDKYYKYDIT